MLSALMFGGGAGGFGAPLHIQPLAAFIGKMVAIDHMHRNRPIGMADADNAIARQRGAALGEVHGDARRGVAAGEQAGAFGFRGNGLAARIVEAPVPVSAAFADRPRLEALRAGLRVRRWPL